MFLGDVNKNTLIMQTIHIKSQNSNIYIGESHKNINKYLPDKKIIIISDKNIYKHYSEFINKYEHIIIPCGETHKTWDTINSICEQLIAYGADRNSFILGMGGGLVSDITGFVASIYMRGLDFAFVSTSLLSQVDASVGGKNGINFGKLKNMLGVFNPPKFVICDINMLDTLPKRELISGFGEIIKHALIKDGDLMSFLISNKDDLLLLNKKLLEDLVFKAVSIKTKVVENDPLEKNERKKLNFGHTIGHAIENNSNLTHGEAVSVGIIMASLLSQKILKLSSVDVNEIYKLLQDFDLPTQYPINAEIINNFLAMDKKKNKDKIDFILLERIGESVIKSIDISYLNNIMPSLLEDNKRYHDNS